MYYKVKVQLKDAPTQVWLPIQAKSIGEAIVIADERCLGTPYGICDTFYEEISEEEYRSLFLKCGRE